MDVILSNPAGLWALLGIPAVLLIHFFQQKSKSRMTSTLFLLKHLNPQSAQGRAFERLRSSGLLWLQLLMVLLVTWVLCAPRWLQPATSQRVVMVLDSSLSMQAYRKPLQSSLADFFARLKKTAAVLDIQIIPSDLTHETVYRGNDPRAALEQIARWTPTRGSHDITPALRAARALADDKSLIVFVSDRPQELPGGIGQIAVGTPFDNTGFLGAGVYKKDGQTLWKAVVKNYSDKPVERQWWIESPEGRKSPAQIVSVGAGSFTMLGGLFPGDMERFTVVMDGDAFPVDDRIPFVRPVSKKIKVWIAPGSKLLPFIQKFIGSVEGAEVTSSEKEADLKIVVLKNPAAPLPSGDSIIFLGEWSDNPPFLKGAVVEESHSLLSDLNFQGLLVQSASSGVVPQPNDEILLWLGVRPLVFVRNSGIHEKLVVNFDPELSNAPRLPSFILLLNRQIERVRSRIIGFEQRNADAGQVVSLAFDPHGAALSAQAISVDVPAGLASLVNPEQKSWTTTLRAPYFPAHAQIAQGGRDLLVLASQFADTREADFSKAAGADTTRERLFEMQARTSRTDFLTPVWILLILALLLASWKIAGGHPGAEKL